MMEFKFDPEKSRSNADKHGIDFEAAQSHWNDPNRVEFIARFKDEERRGVVATLNERLWCAISTLREERIRIISVRRAREYEEEIYYNS